MSGSAANGVGVGAEAGVGLGSTVGTGETGIAVPLGCGVGVNGGGAVAEGLGRGLGEEFITGVGVRLLGWAGGSLVPAPHPASSKTKTKDQVRAAIIALNSHSLPPENSCSQEYTPFSVDHWPSHIADYLIGYYKFAYMQ